jgi:hypothetical protein
VNPERATIDPTIESPPDYREADAATLDRLADAFDTLPPLTRTIFMLSSIDKLPYDEISRCTRLGTEEVKERMFQCFCRLDRYMQEGHAPLIGRIRLALMPLRKAWYAACCREGDRLIARWLPPDKRPGRRKMLDWIVVLLRW